MQRRILFISTIVISLTLLMLTWLALTRTQGSRGEVLDERLVTATEVIVDVPTLAPAYSGDCEEAWRRITTDRGPYAYLTLNASDPENSTNSGKWTPDLPQDGFYRVEAYIPAHDPIAWCTTGRVISSDTAEARYEIHHASGITTKSASQRPLANQWLDLGAYPFNSGTNGYVFLDDLNGEADFSSTISYSALRFTYIGEVTSGYFPFISKIIPTPTPVPSPGVMVSNKAGFDACTLPTISKMQTWWNQSPYYIYGLYLGGISNSSCPKADTAWVSATRQQGWTFIPTWVGPQAPCTDFKFKMSSDPGTAYQQGRSEAEAAFTAAASMGLIKPTQPTVLYYDLEGFGTHPTYDECRQAASSFINGWVSRLHELGQRAGGYGSGCSTYVRDWATIPNVPDDIWAASWYTDNYDPQASVFGVLCLDNSLWANHQRIRQYAGGHNETWGGQTHNIDSNIADGEVAVPNIAAAPTFSLVAAPSQPVIQDMGWLSEEEGWVLTDGNLLWTEDGGATWMNKTPTGGELAAVSFRDKQAGWALPFPAPGEGYQAYHTSDGGSTWEEQSLPVPEGEWQPLQISFIDPVNGWASYRLMTSNIFSLGKLLKTEDGGNTWMVLDLPIGEKVFFEDTLTGWTAGGAGGNELYVTADGGLTWELENPKTANLPILNPFGPDEQFDRQLAGRLEQTTFVTPEVGWAVTVDGTCQGEKGSPNFTCWQASTLWKTVDGGDTWQAATPQLAP